MRHVHNANNLAAKIAAPLKLLSWSIDRSESTTFTKAPPTYPPHVYFAGGSRREGLSASSFLSPEQLLANVRNSDDFTRVFGNDEGWREVTPTSISSSVPGGVRSFLNPSQRARRIAKEKRLEEVCRFIAKTDADVLCLQDCDDESVKAIESLRFTPPPVSQSEGTSKVAPEYRYRFVGAVDITSTGFTCSFVKEATTGQDGSEVSGRVSLSSGWELDALHIGMPFVTFSVRPAGGARSYNRSTHDARGVTISNLDLTHVVKELAAEANSASGKKSDLTSGSSGDLNRNFNYVLRGSLPKAATYAFKTTKDGKMPSDSLQIQREAALALVARGGKRLFTPEMSSGAESTPVVPDIIIGNTHLRHGWTRDRMGNVLPDFVDAWEMAGRNDKNWETYAFYTNPSEVSGCDEQQPTNARYFLDYDQQRDQLDNEDGCGAAAASAAGSRTKGGRYSRCLLHKSLLPNADVARGTSKRVRYECPRPMIEENCSCSDQFPIIVTIQ